MVKYYPVTRRRVVEVPVEVGGEILANRDIIERLEFVDEPSEDAVLRLGIEEVIDEITEEVAIVLVVVADDELGEREVECQIDVSITEDATVDEVVEAVTLAIVLDNETVDEPTHDTRLSLGIEVAPDEPSVETDIIAIITNEETIDEVDEEVGLALSLLDEDADEVSEDVTFIHRNAAESNRTQGSVGNPNNALGWPDGAGPFAVVQRGVLQAANETLWLGGWTVPDDYVVGSAILYTSHSKPLYTVETGVMGVQAPSLNSGALLVLINYGALSGAQNLLGAIDADGNPTGNIHDMSTSPGTGDNVTNRATFNSWLSTATAAQLDTLEVFYRDTSGVTALANTISIDGAILVTEHNL